ncbi:MAG TPA: hypothetical protein VNF99_09730 [Stellaceae bacterium]|nr:hypothetical protein [Stellaceae bacterium]
MSPVEAMRRKLRGLAAVIQDSAATEHERANAERLKAGLKAKLKEEGVPEGDWTDIAFRLGRTVQEIKQTTSPPQSLGDSSKVAFRLGKALRHGLKKWVPK